MTERHAIFTKGTGFGTIAGTPTYYRPGYDTTIEEASIENNADRRRQEDTPEPVGSTEGAFRAFLGLSYAMSSDTHGDVRDIIFNDGGIGFTTGQPAFSRWLVGAEYFDFPGLTSNIVELELQKGIPLSYSINYDQQTNTIRENPRFGFGDLVLNTSFTDTSPTGPAVGNTAPFHGVELTIDGSVVNLDRSIVLDFPEPLSRFQDESSRTPANAVEAGPNPTLTSTVELNTDDYLGLALSGSDTTATTVQDTLGDVAGSLEFKDQEGGTRIVQYDFSKLTLTNWQGQNMVGDRESPTLGVATWNIDGGIGVST